MIMAEEPDTGGRPDRREQREVVGIGCAQLIGENPSWRRVAALTNCIPGRVTLTLPHLPSARTEDDAYFAGSCARRGVDAKRPASSMVQAVRARSV